MSQPNPDIFVVDEQSDLPIWAQLRNRVSYLIRTRQFAPGEQLPSVRSVAASAKINYNTVTKAYRSLESDGLIKNVRGRGMFVADDIPADSQTDTELTDSLLVDCLKRYHGLGMSPGDILRHIQQVAERFERESETE